MKFLDVIKNKMLGPKEPLAVTVLPEETRVRDYAPSDVEERVVRAAHEEKTVSQIAEDAGTYEQLARYYMRKHSLPYKTSKSRKTASVVEKGEIEKDSKSILIIPDAHAKPEVENDRFEWLGSYIADTQPDILVCIGDFADMPSLSSYDFNKKSYEGRRYALDIESVHDAQTRMFKAMGDFRPKRMVMTLGNHENRINRAIEDDSKLEGTISIDQLGYEGFGWEVHKFKEIAMVEGIAFTHYFPNGLMDRAIGGDNVAAGILKKYHCSGVQGHRHDLKFASEVHIDGRRISAIVAGCYFNHHEDYVSRTIQKTYWRGLTHLHNVNNGEFDVEFIRLEQIERVYGRDIAA